MLLLLYASRATPGPDVPVMLLLAKDKLVLLLPYASSSNNTNITFANNNITGTYGVYLYAYSSNNTNITFANNNITGVSYGVYVYLYNGNVKGVNFLNNTINATSGDGFYFYTGGGVTNVTDFVVSGNTIFATNAGLNFTGLSAGSLVNVTVEYNRIIASFGVNVTGHNDNSIFDRNWWGVNDITGMILGVDTFNHFILNITNTSSLDGVHFGDNVSFMLLVLNTTLSNDGVEFLPDFVVNGTFNGDDFNSSRVDGFVYNATATFGVQTLAATLDNVDDNVAFNSLQLTTNSSIIVSNDSVSIGNNVTISGQLANYTGITGVNVTVDGNLYTDVSVNGTGGWNFNYTTNCTGTITVSVTYAGNDNYTAFSNSTSFEVVKNSTNSSIIVASVQIGTNAIISGELVGYVGNGSDILTVSVDGNVYDNIIINSTGGWSLNYTTNRTGNIIITVSYVGNENYTAFINASSFTVILNDTNSSIVVNPETVNIGNNVTISGELVGYVGNGSDILTVSVDDNVYNDVTINSTGGWSLNYTTNRTGNITVSVNYAGNENYTAFNNATSFLVAKNGVNSSINIPSNIKVGDSIIIDGVLADENGNPIANTTITVIIDGENFNVTTADNGSWNINYTPTHAGDFNINVTWEGNDNYTSFTNNTNFNVNKLATYSSIDLSADFRIGKTTVISGVLLDEEDNTIADSELEITIDGKKHLVKTNSNGYWYLTYKPEKTGKTTVVLNFNGDTKYLGFTNSTSFDVKKGETFTNVTVNENKNGSVDLIVKVVDEDGDTIPDYKVNLELDGKYIGSVITDSDGVGIFHIPNSKLTSGKHKITVSSDNENYFSNLAFAEFETKNNNNTNNTNNTNSTNGNGNKTSDNPVAIATMKKTGIPIIAIILVLISIFGISLRRKQ
ncbi:adhesin-like protein [Methanobrevibacter arboriphilus JCM 13429 = DSM 1125]|uniref:Adhesin-like protein n=1 Tax=Methanobrevibacter arboriphilus JCM 13429 = DSM 1125 TaxID=1300164 RepID=A0A1V6N3V3_METAZ|nr:Ig-like domain repeat protein [Methanobrevibacter arboriphilus]OQD59344.1 adhesin-like protein [Methanobrevibacter arboriphilus JCM 13429 = DSM 1125]